MRKFGYWHDPVCWMACAFYGVNRWVIPEAAKTAFLRNHFNDLFFIPAALPLMLWLERELGLRDNDGPPDWGEVLLHLVVWSVAAELVGPRLFPHAVGDILDVAAYAVGAFVATLIWQRK